MDHLTLITSVITLITALVGVVKGFQNASKIQEVHLSINSRMDQLLAASKAESHLEGKAQGIQEQKDRQEH